MNTACVLSCWRVRSAVVISSLCLIAVVILPAKPEEPMTKRDAKEVAKMVDEIVNRNPAPKLVDRPRRRFSQSVVALYPESYDWKEEERVRRAIGKLYQDTTAELWEELVRREA